MRKRGEGEKKGLRESEEKKREWEKGKKEKQQGAGRAAGEQSWGRRECKRKKTISACDREPQHTWTHTYWELVVIHALREESCNQKSRDHRPRAAIYPNGIICFCLLRFQLKFNKFTENLNRVHINSRIFTLKRKAILPYTTIKMNLEDTLSEIRQSQKR